MGDAELYTEIEMNKTKSPSIQSSALQLAINLVGKMVKRKSFKFK